MGYTTWATKKRFHVLITTPAKHFKIMTILDLPASFDKTISENTTHPTKEISKSLSWKAPLLFATTRGGVAHAPRVIVNAARADESNRKLFNPADGCCKSLLMGSLVKMLYRRVPSSAMMTSFMMIIHDDSCSLLFGERASSVWGDSSRG